ncbi:hypothetical protein EIKCOROL_01075 [Eikenella corrodens ATCC 23834]|uniref:Uncharacterized protein n=1 Tax=Eikenella corrodens ATCC 23834 TaxID=546274 RepID=C0DUN9_EIKCO|nr:hypothetical protein EIKCOROL_01075 [Eikenella corrodens ATCC 23834]
MMRGKFWWQVHRNAWYSFISCMHMFSGNLTETGYLKRRVE